MSKTVEEWWSFRCSGNPRLEPFRHIFFECFAAGRASRDEEIAQLKADLRLYQRGLRNGDLDTVEEALLLSFGPTDGMCSERNRRWGWCMGRRSRDEEHKAEVKKLVDAVRFFRDCAVELAVTHTNPEQPANAIGGDWDTHRDTLAAYPAEGGSDGMRTVGH